MSFQIHQWKKELGKRYAEYQSLLSEFSCGAELAGHISSRVAEAKAKVNHAISKCREFDPQCQLKDIQ
jgi:hypothetical protein